MRSKDAKLVEGLSIGSQLSLERETYRAIVRDNEERLKSFSESTAKPDFSKAKIDVSGKIHGYALNPNHPTGKHKARVFLTALGFTQADAVTLAQVIMWKASQMKPVLGQADEHGQRYTIDMPITGRNGKTAMVRTAWIVRPNETEPRLTTVYVLKEEK